MECDMTFPETMQLAAIGMVFAASMFGSLLYAIWRGWKYYVDRKYP